MVDDRTFQNPDTVSGIRCISHICGLAIYLNPINCVRVIVNLKLYRYEKSKFVIIHFGYTKF